MTDYLEAGEVIEGTVTRCERRDLLMDEYFTFAEFLVTRIGPGEAKVAVPIKIVFLDAQSDLVEPPRNSFVRAVVDSTNPFCKEPFSVAEDVIMLTDIAFVDRSTQKIVKRIPLAPHFAD